MDTLIKVNKIYEKSYQQEYAALQQKHNRLQEEVLELQNRANSYAKKLSSIMNPTSLQFVYRQSVEIRKYIAELQQQTIDCKIECEKILEKLKEKMQNRVLIEGMKEKKEKQELLEEQAKEEALLVELSRQVV